MIRKEERRKLKEISEEDHAKDIAQELNDQGIRPRRSEKYNARTITRIMRGEQEDINAEWAIFNHYHELKQRKDELEENRKKLTQTSENGQIDQ